MDNGYVFISHATADDDFVRQLRQELECQGITVWVDSRNLRGGDKLIREVQEAIEKARHVIVVFSPNTVNSPWVRYELRQALEFEHQDRDGDYRVIPLILPGITPPALELWFDEEPVTVPIEVKTGGVSEAVPLILAALGERLPEDVQKQIAVVAKPVAELLLELKDPEIRTADGTRRVSATATLIYTPPEYPAAPRVESRRFRFTAPLGPIQVDELRWYLEHYYMWPTGVFQERAEHIESQLPQWGKDLYKAALGVPTAEKVRQAWEYATEGIERRFSVSVDHDLPEGTSDEEQEAAREAAVDFLALPWELLHDERTYLSQGKYAVRVRRRIPNRDSHGVTATSLPIRILLVSPRPENDQTGYIDHRISALPLVQALESLGELVELTLLTPPTFSHLQHVLKQSSDAQKRFDVIHFDGHGVYDRRYGLGSLCFEEPRDTEKLQKRGVDLVRATTLAAALRDHRIPLVFLEACQTATAEENPSASVAAQLLEEGVASVVAMSHSVLVETARRFVEAFYQDLAKGARVGQAMLAGQLALQSDSYRLKIMGAGDLHLQDWFVPVLYQEEHDPQLFTVLPSEQMRDLQQRRRRLSLGALPDPPPHHFVGRSRALLALERLLVDQPYAVIVGPGGTGKTALAVELARWLVRTDRFQRAAFVSLETYIDERGVLDSLGQQLLPEGENWSVAQFDDPRQAFQTLERAVRDYRTVVVLDNMESLLPDGEGTQPPGATPVEELLVIFQGLLEASSATRLVFTSREGLPKPFEHPRRGVRLGALRQVDAIALVGQVLSKAGLAPAADDAGNTQQEIVDLVESVNGHPRALVLLAREVSHRGVRSTTHELCQLMSALEAKYPGDRENSLYASVELSLRRLTPGMREQIRALGVFYGGASLSVLASTLGIDQHTARDIAKALIDVGVGTYAEHNHFRLDPALSPYILMEMDDKEQEKRRELWADGMIKLIEDLYEKFFRVIDISIKLTLLELPNIMALLEWMQDNATAEQIVEVTNMMETLLNELDRHQALASVIFAQEQAGQSLVEWSHARFQIEDAKIDRLIKSGDFQTACTFAEHLLQRCLNEGEKSYPSAPYDIATAHFTLGSALSKSGAVEKALEPFVKAQEQFQMIAHEGSDSADQMVTRSMSARAYCLRHLGQLREAENIFKEVLKRSTERDDMRHIAATKTDLGVILIQREQYVNALEVYSEAQVIFESLGAQHSVAAIHHRIGQIHREVGYRAQIDGEFNKASEQFEQAEIAYRQGLSLAVQHAILIEESGILTELGNLYEHMMRYEEAVAFYRQSVDINVRVTNLKGEAGNRYNLARVLISLNHYDEARRNLHRALECEEPYGHDIEPWKTWNVLYELEQITGNEKAALHARLQTMRCYIAYRRDGGESQTPGFRLCTAVIQSIEKGYVDEMAQYLSQYLQRVQQPWGKALIPKLQAVLNGSRDLALATDPALDYDDAVELQLLLEHLG